MRTAAPFALAATLGWGIAMTAPVVGAADQIHKSQQNVDKAELQLPSGFKAKDLGQAQNIRGELATVTQDAVTRDDFGKIIDNLATEDRDRMKDYKGQEFKVLDGVVNQIHLDWKQKYGHDLNAGKAKEAFSSRETVVQGTVSDAKVAAANFPASAEAGAEARLASSKQKAQLAETARKDLADGKGVALVRFPVEQMLPEVTASLIEEGNGTWRFAIPTGSSPQQIHRQLQDQLTYFGRDMKQWPANESDPYRMLSHHVIMALYDVNAPETKAK